MPKRDKKEYIISPELQGFLHFLEQVHPLKEASREALLSLCSIKHFRKNETLQPAGHTCRTIYYMHRGIARIHYQKNDHDITDSFAFEGQILVRVESLFTGKPSRKSIDVLEDAVVVALDAPGLFRLYDRYPELERLFRKLFEASHVELVQRIEGIQFHTAEERYRQLLAEAPEMVLRIPLKYIASYLGINPVSLSRIRGRKGN